MNLAEMLAAADAATEGVEVNTGFDPLPEGVYTVVVTQAEGPLDTKTANPQNPTEFGKKLKITADVADGQYQGRKVFINNNILVYPKSMSQQDIANAQTAMAIGNNERKVILGSIGKTTIEDPNELIGATFKVKLSIKDYKGEKQNEVKKIMAIGETLKTPGQVSVPSFAAPSPAPAPAPAATPVKKMPWMK